MQPSPPATAASPEQRRPAPRPRLPRGILLGLVLDLAALITLVIWQIWSFYAVRASFLSGNILAFFEIQSILSAVQILLVGIGLFLVFVGLARLLSGSRPWSRLGAFFVLLGALVGASLNIVYLVLLLIAWSPNPGTGTTYVSVIFEYASPMSLVYQVVIGVGFILALLGIARGVLSQPRTP